MNMDARRMMAALGATLALCSCTTTQVATLPNVNQLDIAAIAKLQLAVGTATVAEPGGTSEVGLNVVTTFRIPGGNNATFQNTPLLIAPMPFISNAVNSNPNTVSGVLPTQLQALASGASKRVPDALTEFGATVGAFGYGLAGDNTVSPSVYQKVYGVLTTCTDIGGVLASISNAPGGPTAPGFNAPRSQELALPVFVPKACGFDGTFTGKPTTTDYYGGPPAWPSPAANAQPTFFLGFPLGFTDFASHPVAGVYQLLVQFTTANDYSTWATMQATATLPSAAVAAPLPLFTQPTLAVQSDGSALIDVTVPAGVTEAVINVNATDCFLAQEPSRPNNNYSILTRITGHQTLFLPSHLGPPDPTNGKPTHTFCTLGDVAEAKALLPPGSVVPTTGNYHLAAVGFDYPAFEASYPQSTSLAPMIANARGSADVTTADPQSVAYTFVTGP
ncbi:MAG: hypothetical protein JOZ91_02885 [Candidatus Eremiobacteraeota bacterium]|nr:hypothetical protein [Candidatus Eremiobacteraeota bacterium]